MRRTTLITLGLILLTSIGIGAVMGRTSGGGAIVSSEVPWGLGGGATPDAVEPGAAGATPPAATSTATVVPGAIGTRPVVVDGGDRLRSAIGGAGGGIGARSPSAGIVATR